MLKIDNNLLVELGLSGLPEAEKNSFLKHIYETLEMRVGIRLADQMTNQQLDEFEQYFEAKDDAGAFKWLETNFPNYKDIVQEEFDKLKAEVAQSAPQILSASQAAAAQTPNQTSAPAPVGSTPAAAQPLLTDSPVPAQPANPMPAPAPTVPMSPVAPAMPPTPPPGPAGPYQPQPPSPPAPTPAADPPAFTPPAPPAQPFTPLSPEPQAPTPPTPPSLPDDQPPAGSGASYGSSSFQN